MKLGSRSRKIVGGLVGLLLGLGAAELALRPFVSLEPHFYRLHDSYLYEFVPGITKTFRHHPGNGGRALFCILTMPGFGVPS